MDIQITQIQPVSINLNVWGRDAGQWRALHQVFAGRQQMAAEPQELVPESPQKRRNSICRNLPIDMLKTQRTRHVNEVNLDDFSSCRYRVYWPLHNT